MKTLLAWFGVIHFVCDLAIVLMILWWNKLSFETADEADSEKPEDKRP